MPDSPPSSGRSAPAATIGPIPDSALANSVCSFRLPDVMPYSTLSTAPMPPAISEARNIGACSWRLRQHREPEREQRARRRR